MLAWAGWHFAADPRLSAECSLRRASESPAVPALCLLSPSAMLLSVVCRWHWCVRCPACVPVHLFPRVTALSHDLA